MTSKKTNVESEVKVLRPLTSSKSMKIKPTDSLSGATGAVKDKKAMDDAEKQCIACVQEASQVESRLRLCS